jgi:hypothetical protein
MPRVEWSVISGANVERGAADALLVTEINHEPTGTEQRVRSYVPNGRVTSLELWRSWTMLATDLSTRPDLPAALRQVCRLVDDMVSRALEKASKPA